MIIIFKLKIDKNKSVPHSIITFSSIITAKVRNRIHISVSPCITFIVERPSSSRDTKPQFQDKNVRELSMAL